VKTKLTNQDSFLYEINLIPEELRVEEAELMMSRWFDYRDLLPAQATLLFAERYEAIYRETYAKTRDLNKAETIELVLVSNLFKSTELIPTWRARQAADRIGCKYDFYLREVFKRIWDRGWRYLPRPNQLYGDEMMSDIKEVWKLETLCSLQLAQSQRFKVASFVGHPDQVAYYDYLVAEIKRREHPHLSLARVVFRDKVLPLEIAGEHFGGDVLRRAHIFGQY